jgi:hypothetical protein
LSRTADKALRLTSKTGSEAADSDDDIGIVLMWREWTEGNRPT